MTTNAHSTIQLITPDSMADEISTLWTNFKHARASWEDEMIEIRNYRMATSTNTTEAGLAGFKNSTTIPKLSQIAMNLQANYNAHLFSNPDWAQFEALDSQAASVDNKEVLEAYVRTKLRRKDYEATLNSIIADWIDTGTGFAQQRYVTETYEGLDGNTQMLYQGTVLDRISPENITFDVTASSFQVARKIIRKTYGLGDIRRLIDEDASTPFTHEILEELRTTRRSVRSSGIHGTTGINWKDIAMTKEGFGTMLQYLQGDTVEVLEFYGDFYSIDSGEYLKNHKIIILDRRKLISSEPIRSRNGSQYIYYSGWEDRPDNLMGMSPLARLVGMQYKLDKLENQRADAFDRIINPPTVERGDVEFYGTRGAPGGRYVTDEDGDVRELNLDATVLNADFQMRNTMELMEEMAGSPRNSSGFRTPGEKTAFEVQFLENGANRIFRTKTNKFETEFIERVLNDMVELALDNLGETDLVSTESGEFNAQKFLAVSKSDLNISGQLRARGSRMFAEKANALQNLLGVYSSPAAALIQPHTSRIALARALEDLGDLKGLNIITPNIGIQEDQQTAQLANQSQQTTEEVDFINTQEPIEED